MSRSKLLRVGRERLRRAGIASFALDAEVLLMHAAGLSRVKLLTEPDARVDADAEARYLEYLCLREKHMPVAYITKSIEFMALELYIDGRALIPRPDTEILAELALEIIRNRGITSVLELCTGSGCIAVALAHSVPGLRVIATDKSAEALELARINIDRHMLGGRVELLCGDLLAPVRGESFDLIIANPPYIKTSDIAGLEPNVRDYEPAAALDGGGDGLDFYRRIFAKAALKPGGVLLLETGFDQARAVAEMAAGYKTEIIKDLSGHDRVIKAERPR